ncbi:DUF2917 domain-containing protein [Undibacterium sp. SXout7W]|uniref:DUF2917 domain-containing protein n=1 Tax=Undibacterium sp. SXout7W TaxID=3413049 RepID=UPI003BEF97F1
MQTTEPITQLHLAAGAVYAVTSEEMICVCIRSGLVWVTVEADTNDYWLRAGDHLHVPKSRLLVIEADVARGHDRNDCQLDLIRIDQHSTALLTGLTLTQPHSALSLAV